MQKPIQSIVLLMSFAAAGWAQSPLVNPGFETGTPGSPPPGWTANVPGYTAQITAEGCNSGKQCLVLESMLESKAAPAANAFGTILQRLDAAPYRGKKFRYRAAVRIEGAARAQLWLRVDLAPGAVGFFDNMGDRPIRSTTWQYFDISGEIDRTGQAIFLGLLIPGAGKVWIDDASFEITGDGDPVEPARPLTSRGLQNLQALTRLYGYIRFFHPTDAAAAADWNRIAMDAVRIVEPAVSPADLASKLQTVFAPVAPSVRVYPTGSTPPPLEVKPAPQVIFWSHHGLGISPQSSYRSTRVLKPAAEAAGLLEPLRSDLPGGVSSAVPLALYRDSPLPPAAAPLPARPSGSGDDRTTRLAAVIIAWNVMQHFYPYFDIAQTDWPAQLPIELSAAAQDKDAAAFAITLRKMVAALHDGHGNVAGGGGQAAFAPPILWTWAEGKIVALSVNGTDVVQPGDAIVSIDGTPVAAVLAAKEALISGATPQWIRYRALTELLTRQRGTPVQLEIETASGRKNVTLTATSTLQQLQEPRPDKVKELEPGIFYLDINRINDADFAGALPSLVNAKGIVFDLRGYPGNIQNIAQFFGHLIKEPATSAQWNFPEVTKPDRVGITFSREGEWRLPPIAPYLTAKRAFIVDGRAISYAESVMGIVENYKLAEIVGEPTAGTNGNVNPLPLPGGYTITWTGMKVLKHDGSQHHGVGIHPTIPVSRTRAGIAAQRDELLERAVLAVKP